ncbi:hypothetical protein [uncultured Treponema sp.]|uniref:hypothetical protein n=1 Tax=uncultured Treponema sp. TaxID=162155 RepID=UPI00258FA3B9|nr:hypothetical protein [uncultured Treponema sp.]
MKKLSKSIISVFIFSAISVFTSCNGVVFDTIREEVKLSDAQIQGTVHSLIRVTDSSDSKEYLYLSANPVVWKKDIDEAVKNGGTDSTDYTTSEHGHWSTTSRPGNNYVRLAANRNGEIYSLSSIVKEVTDDGEMEEISRELKYLDTSDKDAGWQTVTFDDESITSEISLASSIFCTNTPKNENRYAFVRIGGKIYKLEGGKATLIEESSEYNFTSGDNSTSIYSSARGVSTFNGSTFYFTETAAITSNESYNSDATMIYYASGTTVYYRAAGDSGWTSVSCDSSDIRSIAVTKDKLLLGTTSGLDNTALNEGKPTGSATTISANATSTLSSSYTVPILLTIDPTKSDTATDIYAASNFEGNPSSTSATRKNASLWSYYPARSKWNRE